jgi:hypothetical protein
MKVCIKTINKKLRHFIGQLPARDHFMERITLRWYYM